MCNFRGSRNMQRVRQTVGWSVLGLVLTLPIMVAAQSQQPPPTALPGYYSGMDANKATVQRGEGIYLQRCSLCHGARIRKEGTIPAPAPSLVGVLKDAEREPLVRNIIMNGSERMPAWKYSLKDKQMADLMAYLKTL